MTWVYKETEPGLWTVGYHDPDGQWTTDIDCGSRDEAARRVAWLNGAPPPQPAQEGVELQLRVPGGTWYEFRRFVTSFHVPNNIEWRMATRVDLAKQMFDEVAREHAASWPSCATEHTVTATLTGGDAETHAAARDAITAATGVAPDDDRSCMLCNGYSIDHVEVASEGSHGEEVINYRCLVAELSDVIGDMETCEPPVESEWVTTIKLVHDAYKEKLDNG